MTEIPLLSAMASDVIARPYIFQINKGKMTGASSAITQKGDYLQQFPELSKTHCLSSLSSNSVFGCVATWQSSRITSHIYTVRSIKVFGSIGKAETKLTKGEETILLHHKGKGALTHMWFGGDFSGYEQTRIRVYVDGEETCVF
jgi:hypothetical protein